MDQLESLLNDLQKSTRALKQTHSIDRYSEQRPSSSTSDKEPIYEDQHFDSISPADQKPYTMTTTTDMPVEHGLQDLEQLLDDYSAQRGRRQNGRPTVESLLGELDTAVPGQEFKKYTSASTASKDLDDLMSSLSEFKVTSINRQKYTKTTTVNGNREDGGANVTEASYAKPQKVSPVTVQRAPSPSSPSATVGTAQLDSILGSLSSDLNKHGIATIPKGECAACGKTIVGQVVIALGRMWHPEHFSCVHCKEELGHRNFFERSGCAYCETDYHNLFSPRCAYCNGPIKDKCVTALDKTWHPEHFFCATCGKEFGEDGFHEKDGRAFCRADFFAAFAPRCRGCKRAIQNNYITALNNHWHPECFVCQECKRPFSAGSFFDHDDQPLCETHYHEKRGSLCAGASCGQPISGKCVTAMGRKFHPDHFVCAFCLRQLNKGTFKEHQAKPYCHACYAKLLQ